MIKRCRDANVFEAHACHPVLVWIVFRSLPSLHWCTFLEMYFSVTCYHVYIHVTTPSPLPLHLQGTVFPSLHPKLLPPSPGRCSGGGHLPHRPPADRRCPQRGGRRGEVPPEASEGGADAGQFGAGLLVRAQQPGDGGGPPRAGGVCHSHWLRRNPHIRCVGLPDCAAWYMHTCTAVVLSKW